MGEDTTFTEKETEKGTRIKNILSFQIAESSSIPHFAQK